MKSQVGGQWSGISLCGRVSCLLLAAYCLMACSIPNLEPADCTQARDVVREFYSFHFGNDMTFSNENLEIRRTYLTQRFLVDLRDHPPSVDPFTRTDDQPKAFRVGECRVKDAGRRVAFNVLLFWKTDTRTEQQPISVEAVHSGDKWLIDVVGDASTL